MTTKSLPRPRDPTRPAKLIGDIATGQVEDGQVSTKDEGAARGRAGGIKGGGTARSLKLSAERKTEIARAAAAKAASANKCVGTPTKLPLKTKA